MKGAHPRRVTSAARVRATILAAAAACLLACLFPFAASAAFSGPQIDIPFPTANVKPGEKMLVESDQLVYDYDKDTVSAVGNVKIYYSGYTLEAESVTYNKKTGRLSASGHVALTDPSGASYYSEFIDITDDFRDGFVQSLRVDTIQRTHFAAESANRTGGETTTFVNGVYTACEPCAEHPERPVLWNVKAAKIVVDQKEHMIYFSDARMEFFGLPIAYLPYFAVPDPTVKRKSGFLVPDFGYSARVGAYLSTPYFLALAPNYDMTITPTAYTKQGLLADVEWRHRLSNGQYSIHVAGIYQMHPNDFTFPESRKKFRGIIGTTGLFSLAPDWTLGWTGALSTDRGFAADYAVGNSSPSQENSTIYLTGLRGTNYFNAQASYFKVLTQSTNPLYDQTRQAWAAPVVDYQRINDDVLGGRLTLTTNLANTQRDADDPFTIGSNTYYQGVAGNATRVSQEVEWQKRIIGPFGQVITPFAYVKGDAFFLEGATAAPTLTNATATRFMPAIGAEWSLPILITAGGATHIIEPVAQIIARPDEMGAGTLPNNDAQSLVFDTSNLFQYDKFSGFDRVEGGTRANLGVRYTGTFDNGASIQGTFGQSIQIAGTNPFASDPVSNIGAFSGLETKYSDYVGGVTLNNGAGSRIDARARFDNADFNINRGEVQATTVVGPVTASASYLYLRADPLKATPQSAVRGAASVSFAENWRAFGTVTYDITGTRVADDSFGIAFDNECLTASVAYSETHYSALERTQWLKFRLSLRTFSEGSYSTQISKN